MSCPVTVAMSLYTVSPHSPGSFISDSVVGIKFTTRAVKGDRKAVTINK